MSLKTLCPAHAMASVTESFTIDSMHDQRIPCLQGCLVEFYEEVVYIAMMKEVEKGLLDLALQQSRNVHSFEVLVNKLIF